MNTTRRSFFKKLCQVALAGKLLLSEKVAETVTKSVTLTNKQDFWISVDMSEVEDRIVYMLYKVPEGNCLGQWEENMGNTIRKV